MLLPTSLAVRVCGPSRSSWKLMTSAGTRNCSSSNHGPRPHNVSNLLCRKVSQFNVRGSQQLLSFPAMSCRSLQTTSTLGQTESQKSNEQLVSQMHIRLVNENSFLSWCRNAYMSTVVGVAMMAEGTSALAQSAGLGALLVGTMNLAWGTGCHVTNLVRLRHVSGMTSLTLFLHLAGSSLHCVLWAFVLICYIGFLDESRWPADSEQANDGPQKPRLSDRMRGV